MKNNFSLAITTLLFVVGVSCTEKEYRFQLADDPGYVEEPVVAVRALDGDRWIEGNLDKETRTVTFKFHTVASLEDIALDVQLAEDWAQMTSPKTSRFEANLKNGYKFTVNDGVDDISYVINASMFQHIRTVEASFAGEKISLTLSEDSFSGSFASVFLQSDLNGVDIELELDEDAELLTAAEELKGVDFSDGSALKLVVNDKAVGKSKSYYVYVNPSDVVNLGSSWTEVTKTWQNRYNIQFGNMRMYTCSNIAGFSGNIGYLFTIPAERVQMKVMEKNDLGVDLVKMSPAVRNNRDWTLFLCLQGPGVWHIDGSTATSNFTYYSPLAYGPDKSNNTRVLRNDGFGGSNKAYAPAMALQDGKVSISPAGTADGALYRYADAKGNGQTAWTPDCAFGGYFQIVKNGNSMISGEGDKFYNIYNSEWRFFGENLTTFWSPNWGAAAPIVEHDKLRTGRIAVGCTAKGDLVILSVEKFVNTHNQGQNVDLGHNGGSGDTRGVTLYELANAMSAMGCDAAMTVEDYNWSYLLLQDGSERGKDVFWTNNRWVIDTNNATFGNMKAESAENGNLIVVSFK